METEQIAVVMYSPYTAVRETVHAWETHCTIVGLLQAYTVPAVSPVQLAHPFRQFPASLLWLDLCTITTPSLHAQAAS